MLVSGRHNCAQFNPEAPSPRAPHSPSRLPGQALPFTAPSLALVSLYPTAVALPAGRYAWALGVGFWESVPAAAGWGMGAVFQKDSHSLPLHQLHIVFRPSVVLIGAQGPPEVGPQLPVAG